MYACMYVCSMYVCLHVCMYVCIFKCMYAQRELASYEMEIQLKESERDAQLQKERIWRRSQMQQRLIHTLYNHSYIHT